MEDRFTTQGLKSHLSFPFQGENSISRLAILAGLWLAGFIIPVIPWIFCLGYGADIARKSAKGEELTSLPPWEDWNRLFTDGLRMLGAAVITQAPFLVLLYLAAISFMAAILSYGMADKGEELAHLFILMFGMYGSITALLLALAASLVVAAFGPAAMVHMVKEERFAALFAVRRWWPVFRANLAGFLVGWLLIFALGVVVSFLTQISVLTIVLCTIMPLLYVVGMAYLSVVSNRVFGLAYLEGSQKLAPAAAQGEQEPGI